MAYLMTWPLHIHSPSIIAMLYSVSPSIYMSGECMGREQSPIVIRIWGIHFSHMLYVFISSTCLMFTTRRPVIIHEVVFVQSNTK